MVLANEETQDSVSRRKDPRLRIVQAGQVAVASKGLTSVPGAHHYKVPASDEAQDSASRHKDPRSRHLEARLDHVPSIGLTALPGAQHNIPASDETQDLVARQKDPRSRLGKQSQCTELDSALVEPVVGDNGNVGDYAHSNEDVTRLALEADAADVSPGKQAMTSSWKKTMQTSAEADNEAVPVIATADRGMTNPPDVEYGTTALDGVPDAGDLAVAIAIAEEDDDLFLPAAVEFDPDAKPPLIKNRRFRLYAISTVLLFLVTIVAVILGVVVFKPDAKAPPLPQTYAPTGAPSNAPSSGIEGKYREQWVAIVGPKVNVPGTPHDRAATWMLEEDPPLAVNDANVVQRYLLVLFYMMTTDNGQPWLSCNAPKVQNSDNTTCQYQRYSVNDTSDEVIYTPERSFRWLSKKHECSWAGNVCSTNVTRAIELCKYFDAHLISMLILYSHEATNLFTT
jgi:hypothetical protein